MGKASSAKKVARAAGLGGNRAYASRPAYGFYLSVAILVLLGVIGVYNAHEYQMAGKNKQGNHAPHVNVTPPWEEAYAVDACGKVVSNLKSTNDTTGISTTGNGIINISPTKKEYAGYNATLALFASSVGMKLNAGELQLPGGKLYTDGASCEGKAGHVYVETWASPNEAQSVGTVQVSKSTDNGCQPDCDSGTYLEDDQMVTIAFLPAGSSNKPPTNIPQPSKAVIATLNKLESATSTTTTAAPTTTVPTSTTVKGQTTTTAKGQATTTSGATTTSTATTTTTVAKTTTTVAKKSTGTTNKSSNKKAGSKAQGAGT